MSKQQPKPPDIEIIAKVIIATASTTFQLWILWRKFSKKRRKYIDRAQRPKYDALVGGNGHREPQTPSVNQKGKMINKIRRGINHARNSMIKKIHQKTGYLLETTSEQRKKDRKLVRAEKRARRLDRVRNFRPFNWGFLRSIQQKNEQKIRHHDQLAGPLPE